MTVVNPIEVVQSLVSDVSMAFDSLNSKNEAGAELPPSPLNIYKSASLLYQINRNGGGGTDSLNHAMVKLNQVFESILSSMEDEYMSKVILYDINAAFDDLIEKAKYSLDQLSSSRNNTRAKAELEQNLSNCFSAMKPLQIIYGHGRGGDSQQEHVSTHQQTRCCQLGFSPQLCTQIVFLYDAATQLQGSTEIQFCILNTLSSLLTHGLMSTTLEDSPSKDVSEDDAIQFAMQVVQSMSSDQSSTCLGDVIQWQKDHIKDASYTLEKSIDSKFGNQVHAQKEYLLLMLSSAKKSVQKEVNVAAAIFTKTSKVAQQNKAKTNTKPKISGLDRLVMQIKDLFPTYGEGYIEAALACYNHDLEQTTAALLEVQSDPTSKSVHPRIRALDSSLPSRRKESKQRYDDDETEEDIEAKRLQKSRLRELEVEQENEAFILAGAMGEYNDDYDDQYDGVGGEDDIGGADAGLYDMDYESIKVYNRAAKAMEEDRVFWEENRNTNRRNAKGKPKGNNGKEDDDRDSDGGTVDRKYRGPDKGKGGRLIGPDGRYLPYPKKKNGDKNQKPAAANDNQSSGVSQNKKYGTKSGGVKDKSSADGKKKKDGEEMTKIQKRRKNDNKAKIGNHHRKERALKKSAF